MTDTEALEAFGKMFIEGVRDRSIEQIERLLTTAVQGPAHRHLRSIVPNHSAETHSEYMRFAAYVVDDTLAWVLGTFEEADFSGLQVQVRDAEGNAHTLEEISDSLEGELYTKQGWIARFSKVRQHDAHDES